MTRKELDEVIKKDVAGYPLEISEYRFIKIKLSHGGNSSVLWVYEGRERDYILIPGAFCSCKDFILRTIMSKKSRYCKHLLGVHIAINRGKYMSIDMDPGEGFSIIREILDQGISRTLRKKMLKPS